MLNKDKRSLVLLLALGDGCLHYIKNKSGIYGGITIDHGIEQADYQAWKAKLLSYVFDKDVKVRTGHNGKSVQVSVCAKRLRAWRKFCYPGNKKNRANILPFIRHPELAIAVWLMDDGYSEHDKAALRIFTSSSDADTHEVILKWFKDHFDVSPSVKFQKVSAKNKTYPYLRFKYDDSIKIWKLVREFVLTFKSMKHKFRHIERIYQLRFLQPPLRDTKNISE